MSRDLIVLAGPPGAGKTTVGAQVARRSPRAVHLHTDDFWHAIVSGAVPPYETDAHVQNETVLAVIASAAFSYAGGGYVTVVDGVIGPWMVDHFRRHMPANPRVAVHYVVLRPDRETTLARARARSGPSDLTESGPITTMWDQFADLAALEDHVLDTTSDGLEETVARVMTAVAEAGHRL